MGKENINIKWKKAKGGRAFAHELEGWVGDEHCFTIEGTLCVTDLRGINKTPWERPQHYRIPDVENKKDFAKNMAYEILNDINTEWYEANLEKQRLESEHTQNLLTDARELLDKLKNKL